MLPFKVACARLLLFVRFWSRGNAIFLVAVPFPWLLWVFLLSMVCSFDWHAFLLLFVNMLKTLAGSRHAEVVNGGFPLGFCEVLNNHIFVALCVNLPPWLMLGSLWVDVWCQPVRRTYILRMVWFIFA